MKTIKIILFLFLLVPILSCTGKPEKKTAETQTASDPEKIEAYYFHFTARCTTCRTIEASAKEFLETGYPEQFKNGKISFQSVNLDEESSKTLAERLGVTGQALLLVRGEQKINITSEGFLYAVAKPEKFKELISEKVGILMAAK